MKKVTKKEIVEFVKDKLANDEAWAKRALLVIYSYQTTTEQMMGETTDYNNVGFSGADAEILSSFSEQLSNRKWLSPKQLELLMKKMKKYSRQIIEVSDQDKLIELVLKNRNKSVQTSLNL